MVWDTSIVTLAGLHVKPGHQPCRSAQRSASVLGFLDIIALVSRANAQAMHNHEVVRLPRLFTPEKGPIDGLRFVKFKIHGR